MKFDEIVRSAGYAGTKMIPADTAILSLLVLKLLRKERLSHIDDYSLDEALGLFAGLNVLPKKSFATDYANANLMRDEQTAEVLRFAEFWHELTGQYPEWLYFDSKLTTYAQLSELNAKKVYFVTIRRRGTELVRRLEEIPQSQWTPASIDIPKRRQKKIRYLDEVVRLGDYAGTIRQIAVTGLGRARPTLFLTNHPDASPREIIVNYARRNGIEDGLGTNVNFFHMDNLSSEVRLNVDLDVTLTVIANSRYRWLASQLKGFGTAKPKQISRKFIEASGEVEVRPNRTLLVTFDRRCHNPILKEAALDKNRTSIPWIGGLKIKFDFV